MNHKPGITLIELLVYMGVAVILMLAIGTFAYTSLRTHEQANAYASINQELSLTMNRIGNAISEGYAIDPSTTPLPFNLTTAGSRLVIQYRDAGKNPTILFIDKGILFSQAGSGPAIPLHGLQFRITSVLVTSLSSSDNRSKNLQITLGIEQPHLSFGLPNAHSQLSNSFELLDYAP